MKTFLAALALASVAATAGQAATMVVFTDSFENFALTKKWQVFEDGYGDWTSQTGTGIEIQTNGTIGGVSAQDGVKYVELDSDRRRGGDQTPGVGSNSSMTRTETLTVGTYELEWYYLPRTSRPGDNEISVYVANTLDNNIFAQHLGTQDETRPPVDEWVRTVYTFDIFEDGDYGITFAAGGRENTLCGFVDSVTLTRVPLPAAGWMLIAGLGGMAAMARRRKP